MARLEYSLRDNINPLERVRLNVPDFVLEILRDNNEAVLQLKVEGVKTAVFIASKPWVELTLEEGAGPFSVLHKIREQKIFKES